MLNFWKRAPTMEARALLPGHAGACARIHQASFPFAWSEAEFERLLAAENVFADGAFHSRDATLLGFALSRQAADEAEILSIAIAPALHGKGFGRQLLQAHLAQAERRGVRTMFLEVEDANDAARKLYRRAGFLDVGSRPGYYRKAEGAGGAVVMRRQG